MNKNNAAKKNRQGEIFGGLASLTKVSKVEIKFCSIFSPIFVRALELSAGIRIKADVSFDLTPEEIISIRVSHKRVHFCMLTFTVTLV